MANAVGTNHRVHFKSFELDLHTRELYRNGIRLKVLGQPIDVLVMLLERPGELVTREELRKKLWPEDTFVDFEHSLNSAVMRLRDALGDRAERPKFIETLPRMGYRFIEQVEPEIEPPDDRAILSGTSGNAAVWVRQVANVVPITSGLEVAPEPAVAPKKSPRYRTLRQWQLALLLASSVVLLVAAALLWYVNRKHPLPRISEMARITNDLHRNGKLVIGNDGSRVFFRIEGDTPILGQVPVEGGEISTTRLLVPNLTRFEAVSPDGNSVIVHGKSDPERNTSELWIAGTTGRPLRYLTEGSSSGGTASWSADGKEIIYLTADRKVYTVPNTGGSPHLLRALDGPAVFFAYSPDGNKIRFSYRKDSRVWRLWEMSSKGDNLHELLPDWRPDLSIWNGRWTPDGAFFVFLVTGSDLRFTILTAPSQIWAIDERDGLFRRPSPLPTQLTTGPETWSSPFPSRDGRQIFAESTDRRGDLLRYDLKTKQLEPYLNGVSAEMLNFSADGRTVIYTSYPAGMLSRSNKDGSGIQQVSKAPDHYSASPRISPDGSRIVFVDFAEGPGSLKASMYLVPSRGGVPVQVLPDDAEDQFDPTWSPDGKKLAFAPRAFSQTKPIDRATEVRIVDLATKEVSYLPAPPKRARSPRWSPDGNSIVCQTVPGELMPDDGLQVFDFKTAKWKVILQGQSAQWPTWSPDGEWIYFVDYRDSRHLAFYRIQRNGGARELIAELAEFRGAGLFWSWFGFDPDGNPLMLRDEGTDEIYALTLDRQ